MYIVYLGKHGGGGDRAAVTVCTTEANQHGVIITQHAFNLNAVIQKQDAVVSECRGVHKVGMAAQSIDMVEGVRHLSCRATCHVVYWC